MMNRVLKNISYFSIIGLLLFTFFACKKETVYVDAKEDSIDNNSEEEIPSSSNKVFLGEVGKDVERVENEEVTLDLNYTEDNNKSLRIKTAPQPQFSTGLYAPAGETVTINVPDGISGLTAQIGAWTDDVPGIPGMDEKILSTQGLSSGENEISNDYGGPIYILAANPISNPVKLSFSGAVEMTDFILGETDAADWWSQVKDNQVPWLELKADHIIITVPKETLIQNEISNPTNLLSAWNQAIKENIYPWMGIKENQFVLPYRIVLDKRLFSESMHSGYPIVLSSRDSFLGSFEKISDLNKAIWKGFSLLGENFQQEAWTWDGIKEVTNDLYIFGAAHQLNKDIKDWAVGLNIDLDKVFEDGLDFVNNSNLDKNFDTYFSDPLSKLLPFLQIFEKAEPANGNGTDGYDFMTFLSKKVQDLNTLPTSNQDKKDFFYKTLSEFTGKDWKAFFDVWGINLSPEVVQEVEDKGYDIITKMKWTYNPMTEDGGDKDIYYQNKFWKIIDFSTEETSQGEINNGGGPAKFAIDGDKDTYWHSRWNGSGSTPPHHLTIDMQKELEVGSFYFYQRQDPSDVRIKNIRIEISDDKTNWTPIAVCHLEDNTDKQTFKLDTKENFRYFKIIVPTKDDEYDANVNTYVALAEVGVNKEQTGKAVSEPQDNTSNNDDYDVTNWSIYKTNSEVTTGVEGAGGGHAKNIIDDDVNTYWNADWQAQDDFPFYIIVDMQKDLEVSSFTFVERQIEEGETNDNTKINKVQILTSNDPDADANDWTDLGTYDLDVTILDPQTVSLTGGTQTMRYFKLVIQDKSFTGTTGNEANYPALAEVSVNK